MRPSILIVDDDTNMLVAFKGMFRKKFYHVLTACSLRETLDMVSQFHPHVVILDVKIRNETGNNLLGLLKAHYPDLPVIVVTAFTDIFTRKKAMEMGADGYFPKPFDPNELKETVNRLADSTGITVTDP